MSEQANSSKTPNFQHLLNGAENFLSVKRVLEDSQKAPGPTDFRPTKSPRLRNKSSGVESTTLFQSSSTRQHAGTAVYPGTSVEDNAHGPAATQMGSRDEGVANLNFPNPSSQRMGPPAARLEPQKSPSPVPSPATTPSGSGSELNQTHTSSGMPPYPGFGLPTPNPTTRNAILKLFEVTEKGDSLEENNANHEEQEAMIDILFDAADAVEEAIDTYISTDLKFDGRLHPKQQDELVEFMLYNDNIGHAINRVPELKPEETEENVTEKRANSKKELFTASLIKEHQSKEATLVRAVVVTMLKERGDTLVELPELGEEADPTKEIRKDRNKHIQYTDDSRPRNTLFEAAYTVKQWAFHYVSKLTMLCGSAVLGILPSEVLSLLELKINDDRYSSKSTQSAKKKSDKAAASAKKPPVPKLGPSFIGLIMALIRVALLKKLKGSGVRVYWCRNSRSGREAFLKDLDHQYQWRAWIIRWLDQNTIETYSLEYFLQRLRVAGVDESSTIRGLFSLNSSSLQTYSPSYLAGIIHDGNCTQKAKGRSTVKKRDVVNATESLDDLEVRYLVPPVRRQGPEINVRRFSLQKNTRQDARPVDGSEPATEPSRTSNIGQRSRKATSLRISPTTAPTTMLGPATLQPHNPASASTLASASRVVPGMMYHDNLPSSFNQSTALRTAPNITVRQDSLYMPQSGQTLTSQPQASTSHLTYTSGQTLTSQPQASTSHLTYTSGQTLTSQPQASTSHLTYTSGQTLTSQPQASTSHLTYTSGRDSSQFTGEYRTSNSNQVPSETVYASDYYNITTTSTSSSANYFPSQPMQPMQYPGLQQVSTTTSMTEQDTGGDYGAMDVDSTALTGGRSWGGYPMRPDMVSAPQSSLLPLSNNYGTAYGNSQDQHTNTTDYTHLPQQSRGDLTPTQGNYPLADPQANFQTGYGGTTTTWDQPEWTGNGAARGIQQSWDT